MIDFDALVLAPCMNVFARPITVFPVRSQPAGSAYQARGSWHARPVDVIADEGQVISSETYTLGIREKEFSVPIVQGDRIEIPAYQTLARVGLFVVDDADVDGQGGTTLTLKMIGP